MKKYYILAAAAIALAACNNDDNYIDQPVAAQISATIGDSQSRAAGEKWAANDKIGITMGDKYFNMEYTTQEGDGTFDGTTMYFRNKTDNVEFTAYYPFTGTSGETPDLIALSTTAEKQTPDQQSKFDFLYATDRTTGATPKVTFNFSHKMGQLTLIFKNGNDGTDVSKIQSYKINGLVLDGTFNTVTGDCAADGTEATELAISLPEGTVENGEPITSLLLFPQPVPAETVTLSISDSEGQDYSCTLNFDGNSIASGNNYQFTIAVNKKELVVNKSTIENWNTKESSANADAD